MDLGLFQRDVAAKVGADEASVWLWENERSSPELRFLPAVLALLEYDPRPAPKTLAARLVHFRQGRGWSQKRLAKELRVDPTTLARWERGQKKPWGAFLDRVSALLASDGPKAEPAR